MRESFTVRRRLVEHLRLLGVVIGLVALGAGVAWAQDDTGTEEVSEDTLPPSGTGLALVDETFDVSPPEVETGAVSGEAAPPAEPVGVSRITFDVPFSEDKGGGSARGSAGTMEYLGEDRIIASGAVEFTFQNVRVQAQRVTVDLATREILAEGNVILDEGPGRISGTSLAYDLNTRTGQVTDAQAFMDPDVFMTGEEIAKESDTVYTITKGTITSCSEDEVPDWSFKLARARVNLDGFARVRNTTLRFKKMPFLYLPYMVFPAQRGRVSGFLFPQIGYSETRGALLGLAWYQTLGRSYDATFYADIYGEDFLGLGAEFRYRPSQGTTGFLQAFAIDDPGDSNDPDAVSETRWKALYTHSSEDLPFGFRGVINYRDFSDFNFFRDFERDFNNVTIRSLWSSAFLSGSWGSHSLNLLVDDRETFIRNNVFVTQRQLPEIEYRLRPTKLWKTPVYFELLSSIANFEVGRTDVLEATYARADFLPTLTLPLSPAPWLSLSLTASNRTTLYDDSVNDDRTAFTGESLTRSFPTARADIIGPSFSKIIDKKIGKFGKFKHVIEPRWAYLKVGEFDEQDRVPSFDEVDPQQDLEGWSFTLVNRLLAKPADEDSLEGAREILSFEIGQSFSLQDDQPGQVSRDGTMSKQEGPINAKLRFNPSRRTSYEVRAEYNTLFGHLREASLLGGTAFGQHGISLSWAVRQDPELETTTSHQARVATGFQLVRNRLRLDSQVSMNLQTGLLQQQRHVLTYTSQCYGLRFEWRELSRLIASNDSTRRQADFRVALSLKNIGTFLDLGSGSGDGFGR